MIYITGDTHGHYDRFLNDKSIKSLTEKDYLIVCGDFGFINSAEGTIMQIIEDEILDEMERLSYTVLFIDGVNEHFDRLNSYPVEVWNGGKVHRIRKNIAHLMRGQVFEIEGKRIFSMGGAISDDIYTLNKPKKELDFTVKSLPTQAELDEGRSNLQKNNFTVDVILTHTPTAEAITSNWHSVRNPNGGALLPFLDNIIAEVEYKCWYFGLVHMDMHKGIEQSPLGKYCAANKMRPVCFDVIGVE
jgi:predicted phosphodiesterase